MRQARARIAESRPARALAARDFEMAGTIYTIYCRIHTIYYIITCYILYTMCSLK